MNFQNMLMVLLFAKVCLNDIPHMLEYQEKRQELVDTYGAWSVGRAEAVCTRGDIKCIEAEAARLQGLVRAKWAPYSA
jgi:hypothetical protein